MDVRIGGGHRWIDSARCRVYQNREVYKTRPAAAFIPEALVGYRVGPTGLRADLRSFCGIRCGLGSIAGAFFSGSASRSLSFTLERFFCVDSKILTTCAIDGIRLF
jgi:hypothetical protein